MPPCLPFDVDTDSDLASELCHDAEYGICELAMPIEGCERYSTAWLLIGGEAIVEYCTGEARGVTEMASCLYTKDGISHASTMGRCSCPNTCG